MIHHLVAQIDISIISFVPSKEKQSIIFKKLHPNLISILQCGNHSFQTTIPKYPCHNKATHLKFCPSTNASSSSILQHSCPSSHNTVIHISTISISKLGFSSTGITVFHHSNQYFLILYLTTLHPFTSQLSITLSFYQCFLDIYHATQLYPSSHKTAISHPSF